MQIAKMREKVRKAKEQKANMQVKFRAAKGAHILLMTKMGLPEEAAMQVVSRKNLRGKVTATLKKGTTLHAVCQAFDELKAITAKIKKEKDDQSRFEAQHTKSVNNLEELKHDKEMAFALLESVNDQLTKAEDVQKANP